MLALGGAAGVGEMVLHDMRQVASNVQGGVIPECGHFIAEERPALLAESLLKFFDEVRRQEEDVR